MTNANQSIILPDSEQMRAHLLSSLSRYWPTGSSLICGLPLNGITAAPSDQSPIETSIVQLPEWAARVQLMAVF